MSSRQTMAELSGRKYPIYKMKDLVPGLVGNEESNDGETSQMSKPRSMGKKHLPVRISMMHFNDPPGSRNPGSSRKPADLSMRKPIRNIHKLLESPKRSVRKRLDNLYDCSKSRENNNSTTVKPQSLSAKKMAPKTPTAAVTYNPRSLKNNDTSKRNENSRQSRLLPPGTITGSYLNKRSSTAARTSIFEPIGNPPLIPKNSQIKRPSNVPEESPQPLEKSDDSNKLVADAQRIDGDGLLDSADQTSSVNDARKEKEMPTRCCDCSRAVVDSNATDNTSKLLDGSVNSLENAKDIAKQESDVGDDDKFQRPTVIVMQKEATLQPEEVTEGLDASPVIRLLEGSYSEMLNIRPSMNSTETDESLLFKNIETTCFQSERADRTERDDEMREYICKWISMNNRTLVTQQKQLTESIAQHEKSITGLKLMLENVNSLLHMQETLRSNFKSKEWRNSSDAELSLIPRYDDTKISESGKKKNCKSSSKKNKVHLEEGNSLEAANGESKTVKSGDKEAQLKNDDVERMTNNKPNADENETENIENEPPTRRRSARLAIKNANLSSLADQNTPQMEEKKSKASTAKSNPFTPNMSTPGRGVRWGRRSERPLREYMVLKSAIKCLNTPDSKRYRIGSDGRVQIRDSLSKTDPEAGLTDKLLVELHELYATP